MKLDWGSKLWLKLWLIAAVIIPYDYNSNIVLRRVIDDLCGYYLLSISISFIVWNILTECLHFHA
jgi:hypothetical protein